jgi:hypothetical protein
MSTTRTTAVTFGNPAKAVLLSGLLVGILYAIALAFAERRWPINPDYTALEVIGGVLLTGLVVGVNARHEAKYAGLSWRDYEHLVIVGFCATGAPIIIWQVVEFVLRHMA